MQISVLFMLSEVVQLMSCEDVCMLCANIMLLCASETGACQVLVLLESSRIKLLEILKEDTSCLLSYANMAIIAH